MRKGKARIKDDYSKIQIEEIKTKIERATKEHEKEISALKTKIKTIRTEQHNKEIEFMIEPMSKIVENMADLMFYTSDITMKHLFSKEEYELMKKFHKFIDAAHDRLLDAQQMGEFDNES